MKNNEILKFLMTRKNWLSVENDIIVNCFYVYIYNLDTSTERKEIESLSFNRRVNYEFLRCLKN